MPPAKQARVRAGLDLPALLKMKEPLTIVVSRLRNGMKENIPLDIREGYAAGGVGWTVDDVKAIDQELIDIAGGGIYEAQVTDSSGETGGEPQHTSWTFYIPTEVYPVKSPRTMGPAPVTYPGYPQAGAVPPAYGLPPFTPPGLAGSHAATPRPAPGIDPTVAAALAANQQNQNMTSQVYQRDLAAIEEKYRHQREADELKRQLEEARRVPVHDDRYERERAAREAAERTVAEARATAERAVAEAQRLAAESQARSEREAAERRAEERQRTLEAQIAEDRRRADEKFAQLMSQMALMAQRPTGPDPVLQMMMENQRQAAEAAREAARITAETEREKARLKAEADKEVARARAEEARVAAESQQKLIMTVQSMMAPNQMSPMDAAKVVREASQGADQFTRQIVGSMNDMMDIQRNFLSNMMQMAPQGESTAGRIVSAIENVAQTVTQSQAQVAAAQAHAQAQAQRGPMPGWQTPPPVAPTGAAAPQPQPADTNVGGLAGVTREADGATRDANGSMVTPPPVAVPDANATTPGGALPPPSAAVVRHGKTDEQWFGPALPDVLRLREGAMKYLVETTHDEVNIDQLKPNEPPTVVDDHGKAIGVSPVYAAQIILIAVNEIGSKNIPGVEAYEYFWKQQMFPALVDVMIPDAPAEYRTQVLMYMNRLLSGQSLMQQGDEPLYGLAKYLDDDTAEDADGPSNGAPTPMPAPLPRAQVVTGGRTRAR